MKNQFKGKVAVVTGGTQGLGEAIARLLAERGAAGLLIVGRNKKRGKAVADDITKGGCKTVFVSADLGDLAAARKIIPAAEKAFGRVDVLVNAAAITDRGNLVDTSPELYGAMFDINTRAPFFLMQDAAKLMIRKKIKGTMVNILSMAAHGGLPHIIAYSASKAALGIITRSAGFQLAKNQIRANALNIGWMDTPGEDRIQRHYHGGGDDWLEKAEKSAPFGRILKPAEVAKAVAFLASDESGMMTGAIVDFDQQVLGVAEGANWATKPLTV